ncbi:MAG: RNA polymerase sigma factor [Lachnospiraceae bacterium]|nr:RNA polymerase sigma factor [Lachnospiraceae bacterium]
MIKQEFQELIERDGKAIYSFCRALTANREEADELYQDTMLAAVEHCKDIDGSANPKAYLDSIAVGLYRNRRKKFMRRQQIAPMEGLTDELLTVLADERMGLEEQIILGELQQTVRRETQALSEKLRLPVYLYYTAQLSIEEIAKILKLPGGTVKSRLHKARMVMKKRLEDCGYENG